jgi:CHAT domain-containing protein
VYRIERSGGRDFTMNFTMPLENVTSWDDYRQKKEEQKRERHEKINQAIAAGKFRLLNVEVMQTNICRDAESGKKFMVQRMGAGTERDIAVPKTDFGEIPPSVKETSWKEHLQAIRDGKRELLDSHSTNDYKYEMTTDDGSKLMFGYGGDEPLREMPKD